MSLAYFKTGGFGIENDLPHACSLNCSACSRAA
jgi:hypothetical protein